MKAYQLLARLKHLTLTQGNWKEEMFIGKEAYWYKVTLDERKHE